MKKYLAEFFGTFILVFLGCSAAVVCGGYTGGTDLEYLGVVAIALAFGLSIVAAAYAIGNISGCHVNPAVSFAFFINGRIGKKDLLGYVIAQFAGAFVGSGILSYIVSNSNIPPATGANGYGELSAVGISLSGAILVEIILTFVFILTVLGVTSVPKTSNIAGIVIGLTLTLVHIIGIPLTGTSVNPARSLSAAVFAGGDALSQIWVFLIAPLIGSFLAAIIFKVLFAPKKTNRNYNREV